MDKKERKRYLALQALLLKIKEMIDQYLEQHCLDSKEDRGSHGNDISLLDGESISEQ